MKVTLIAGHGAGDPGCSGRLGGKVYREADETRTLVPLIANRLMANGVDVVIRDMNRNAFTDANAGQLVFPSDVKYLLEVHFNAVNQSAADNRIKGVECYVTENESRVTVENKICEAIANIGFTNRGVKKRNLKVIKTAKDKGISSALLEVCFLDDEDDLRLYLLNREKIAVAIADAICDGFGVKPIVPSSANSMDNTPSNWAKSGCKWAVEKGVFQGDENGNMHWHDPVTREQLAVILSRLF